MKKFILMVAALMCYVAVSAQGGVVENFNKGNEEFKAKNYVAAIELFEGVIIDGEAEESDAASMQELLEALLRANVLWEKKWVACGDSFTEGDFKDSDEEYLFADGLYAGQKKVYPFFIGRRNHMTIVGKAYS